MAQFIVYYFKTYYIQEDEQHKVLSVHALNPTGRPLCGEHKSRGENLTQSDST